ncbi:hypothetical protein [Halovivax limisalsi]|uniref:hypothetical protein n=1 Tax=Halovivax limisalsi TaxID=1453760 RepID=UPI001FFDEB66|nr:hypothetical protein [Halovivax limisalsi]
MSPSQQVPTRRTVLRSLAAGTVFGIGGTTAAAAGTGARSSRSTTDEAGGECGDETETTTETGFLSWWNEGDVYTYSTTTSEPCGIEIELDGPGEFANVDLYVTYDGREPTTGDYDDRSTGPSDDEVIESDLDGQTDVGILVHDAQGWGEYTLTVTETGESDELGKRRFEIAAEATIQADPVEETTFETGWMELGPHLQVQCSGPAYDQGTVYVDGLTRNDEMVEDFTDVPTGPLEDAEEWEITKGDGGDPAEFTVIEDEDRALAGSKLLEIDVGTATSAVARPAFDPSSVEVGDRLGARFRHEGTGGDDAATPVVRWFTDEPTDGHFGFGTGVYEAGHGQYWGGTSQARAWGQEQVEEYGAGTRGWQPGESTTAPGRAALTDIDVDDGVWYGIRLEILDIEHEGDG